MQIHHKIAHSLGYDLVRHKRSHEKYLHHLPKLLEKYQINTVIDVGANIGQFATNLRSAGFNGRIISFEPLKSCFELLLSKSTKDPLWDCYNFALGEKNLKQDITVPKGSDFSSFYKTNDYAHHLFPKELDNIQYETVEIKKFSDWINQNLQIFEKRCFLKLDTQGYDLSVIKGAESYLERFYGLSTELAFKKLYDGIPDYLETLNFLQAKGFNVSGIFTITRDQKTLELVESDAVLINSKFTNS